VHEQDLTMMLESRAAVEADQGGIAHGGGETDLVSTAAACVIHRGLQEGSAETAAPRRGEDEEIVDPRKGRGSQRRWAEGDGDQSDG
jgi:hypothetical protein